MNNQTGLSASEGNFDENRTFRGVDYDLTPGRHASYHVIIDDVEYPNCVDSVDVPNSTPTPEVEVTPTSVPCSTLWTVEVHTGMGGSHWVDLELSSGGPWGGLTFDSGIAGPTSFDPSVTVTGVSIDGVRVNVTTDDNDGALPTGGAGCHWRKIFVSPSRNNPTSTPMPSPTPPVSSAALVATGADSSVPPWVYISVAILVITALVVAFRRRGK
ncbi:MAG: hypothetical protein AAB909_04100 [Patescibacteria group bacterium]